MKKQLLSIPIALSLGIVPCIYGMESSLQNLSLGTESPLAQQGARAACELVLHTLTTTPAPKPRLTKLQSQHFKKELLKRENLICQTLAHAQCSNEEIINDAQHLTSAIQNKPDVFVSSIQEKKINRNQQGIPIIKHFLCEPLKGSCDKKEWAPTTDIINQTRSAIFKNRTSLSDAEILTNIGCQKNDTHFIKPFPSLVAYNKQQSNLLPEEIKQILDRLFAGLTPELMIPEIASNIEVNTVSMGTIKNVLIQAATTIKYTHLLQHGFTELTPFILEHPELPGYIIKLCKFDCKNAFNKHYQRIPFSNFLRHKIEKLNLHITIPKKYSYFVGDMLIVVAEKKNISEQKPFTQKQWQDIETIINHGYVDPHDENVYGLGDQATIIDTEPHIGPTSACWHFLYGDSELTKELKTLTCNSPYPSFNSSAQFNLHELKTKHPEYNTFKHCAHCKTLAENNCSACRQVSYCSRECQKADWKKHKDQCNQASTSSNKS